MSSWKDVLIKKLDDLCYHLGIDPVLPILLVVLLISINKLKHVKIWNVLSVSEKNWDIVIWTMSLLGFLFFFIKLIRGN